MNLLRSYKIFLFCFCVVYVGCKVPAITETQHSKPIPGSWDNSSDTNNIATIAWRDFFTDKNLISLIDSGLKNNQDLLITLQDIEIAQNDIKFRQGDLLPKVFAGGGIGVEKVGRYTSQGAGDASTEMTPGKPVQDWLPDYRAGINADWEVDIWKKLRNAKKAAITRYLSTIEGKNFVITNLVAEIANTYYELTALDNQLDIVRQSIKLQQNALEILRVQKQAAVVNELAVKRFEAEVLNSQHLEYEILQNVSVAQNKLNFLLGRYPEQIARDKSAFINGTINQVKAGIPSQLLANRPDIKQAELELAASRLDLKVARAEFYPSLNISAGVGLQAFSPQYFLKMPESLIFSAVGDLAGPIINRKQIQAEFNKANARQVQAMYSYERTLVNAYIEVSNELSNLSNLDKMYDLKAREVDTLVASIDISNDLFKSGRADYLEVLFTQRDALASRLELIETKKKQYNSITNIYRSLGGGWK